MQDRSSNRPRDPNQLAKLVVDIAIGASEEDAPVASLRHKDADAVSLGRRGGLKGGKARAAKLSDDQRSAIARAAAVARWSKKGEKT